MKKFKLEFYEIQYLAAIVKFSKELGEQYSKENTTNRAVNNLVVQGLFPLELKLTKRLLQHQNKSYNLGIDVITASAIMANKVSISDSSGDDVEVIRAFYIRLLTICEQVIINH